MCSPVRTVEPTRSSPSVRGGREVSVTLSILSRLTARAKSSAVKVIDSPRIADLAIKFSSHNRSIAVEMGSPEVCATEQEDRQNIADATSNNTDARRRMRLILLFIIFPPYISSTTIL